MRITAPIDRPLQDEHVIAIDPPLRPEQDTWRRRINPFTGRSISHHALAAEQDWRSGAQRLLGQGVTPGLIDGLDLHVEPGALGALPEAVTLQLLPGIGLARSGEDIVVSAPRRLRLADLRVHARVDHLDSIAGGEAPEPPALPDAGTSGLRPALPRRTGPMFGEIAASGRADMLPRAAILVAEPVTATILAGPQDRCAPDPRDDPYDDLQLIDGVRLILYPWPTEVTAVTGGPDYALPPAGPTFRNRLAYRVFETERVHGPRNGHPWEAIGLPLALLGFNPDWTLAFVDRSAVARLGGRPMPRSPLDLTAGSPVLWQARVAQFSEQLASEASLADGRLADVFAFLPPTGFLPGTVANLTTRVQRAFPPNLSITAAPIPIDNADLVIAEAASLDPIDLAGTEELELLLPVPGDLYDPRLLEIDAVDPGFATAIAAFTASRNQWFFRREAVRRAITLLRASLTGVWMPWQPADLPADEIAPAGAAPLTAARIRRVAATDGAAHSHGYTGATTPLRPEAGGRIHVWVRVTAAGAQPALLLRLGAASEDALRPGVWWGSSESAVGERPVERRAGDLPPAGIWSRLEVSTDADWGGPALAGLAVTAFEFGQSDVTVEWGPIGLITADGGETILLGEHLPEGSQPFSDSETGAWPSVDVAPEDARGEPEFGVIVEEDHAVVAAIRALRGRWTQPFLSEDFAALDESGLDGFIAKLDSRLKQTNDKIDFSFLRARADIYRLRQFMLGADAASKLVTSPALADIAVRDEGARVRDADLTAFLGEAYRSAPERNAEAPVTRKPLADASGAAPRSTPAALGAGALAAGGFLATPELRLATPFEAPPLATSPAMLAPIEPRLSVEGTKAALAGTTALVTADVVFQRPLPELVERTVSVAERITLAPAVEVQGYAMAGKLGALGAAEELIGGADRPGIALADLPIPGFKYDPAGDPPGERRKNTIGDLLFNPDDYSDTDALDDTADRHEAAYFTAATKSIDSSVALLRLIEGRAALYQRLLADAREVRQTVDGTRLAAARRLHVIGVELAEARHDLATARALLAEEQARVAAINRRRAHTIERHAGALLFRRPRRTDRMQPVATARAVAALAPSAIVTCRREHHAPPEEVQDYVALMRELPAASFPAVSAGIAAIDRLDAARRALVSVKARAELPLVRNVVPVAAAQPRIAQAVSAALATQFSAVETHRSALRALDLSAIARIDLDAVRRGFAEAATLADVVDGSHARPDLARLAAAELEAIGQIAACLHAAFSEVAPVLRLAWAETLSEFDQTIPLAELSAVPRWGEVPLDLRRELQELTNGLFARIDRAFAPGFHAISELVRICLLMSAQSPVDRIIPARLIAPAPVVVGSVLTLAADVRLVRVGMTAIVRREDGAPALRAAIDDIGDGIARARVTERLDPGLTNLTAGLTVDLSHVWRA